MNKKEYFGADGDLLWINFDTDETKNITFLQEFGVDEEILAYSLDINERARVEYDDLSDTFILIFNVPKLEKIDNHYETIPITFLIRNSQLVTISNSKNVYVVDLMTRYLESHRSNSLFQFLFSTLFLIADSYFPLVEEMNSERNRTNDKLKEKTTKQNLLGLSDLETGLVYFVSASKQNAILLEQVKTLSIYRQLDQIEKEQLEDAIIEAKQLVEMTQLATQILKQLSATYNNVLNNNLNDTMKILTTLSILLTVPTIVTGFFGMNMPLPLEHNVTGWLITIAISICGWLGLSFVLSKIMK
ncbi:hypothetical protein RU97_GL000811 [Enterococcus canis]|uniref:Magnesium transporter CorA n=1 Tax=Enterococcus canis TaxID=214095 RepID=A0A1L8RHK1_9ENTE|nr:magnesium transporter CorA family protein [Enterococcus canis]OJG19240.1 hypothetical protein RU97_GL000811 [Enterococcus canis]